MMGTSGRSACSSCARSEEDAAEIAVGLQQRGGRRAAPHDGQKTVPVAKAPDRRHQTAALVEDQNLAERQDFGSFIHPTLSSFHCDRSVIA
jgi:hypothetical protein